MSTYPEEFSRIEARAEAAEARCARLEEALHLAVREMNIAKDYLRQDYRTEEPGCFDDSLQFCQDTLSDTAQQETGDKPRTYVNRRAIDMD